LAYRKERYRLRFLGLSEPMEEQVRQALQGAEFRPPKSSMPRVTNVLLFNLWEEMDLTALYSVVDTLQLGPAQFEVIASVVTTSDNGGVDLPEYILRLIRRTQCSVGFSFVSTGPDATGDDNGTSKE
jgi:hypothetical protein